MTSKGMIYVSGALMASLNLAEARAKYEFCAETLVQAGFSAYVPHKRTDPHHMVHLEATSVFERDAQALLQSDAAVAFLDEPSHGVGAELAICVERKIPVVALAQKDAQVSRFILGMLDASETSTVFRYSDLIEVQKILPLEILRLLSQTKKLEPCMVTRASSKAKSLLSRDRRIEPHVER